MRWTLIVALALMSAACKSYRGAVTSRRAAITDCAARSRIGVHPSAAACLVERYAWAPAAAESTTLTIREHPRICLVVPDNIECQARFASFRQVLDEAQALRRQGAPDSVRDRFVRERTPFSDAAGLESTVIFMVIHEVTDTSR
jgi:hypothetical protein